MRINAALASVQSARAGYPYGQLATTYIQSAAKAGILRAAIPADVPDTAVVTKADLVFHARGNWAGSDVWSAQRNADGWSASKVTWTNRPGVTGSSQSVTVSGASDGDVFRIDVSAHVQAFVSGTQTNRGWRITNDETTFARPIYGATAGKFKPYLDFEYVVPGDPPGGLVPDGAAVSIAKPTLTFDSADEIIAIRVQIDAAADGGSPDWDSNSDYPSGVPAVAGLLDLSGTSYPGLSNGATTYWRAQVKSDDGWTLWSDWATMPRVNKPPLTITGPASTTGDKTPPIAWTFSGQTLWHAWLTKPNGKVIDDSERTASNDHEWTPEKGLKKVGTTGRAYVRAWDNVDRVATPGDPIWVEAHVDFELVAIHDAEGADAITATQDGPSPVVRVSFEGPTPDLWQITRDGEWLDRIDGSASHYYDYTAAPLTDHVYQALVATDDGAVCPNGPTATIRTRPAGLWLIDPDTDERILILDEVVETTTPERAVLHTPVGDAAPIRRRSGTPPPSGTVTGLLLDSLAGDDYDPATMAATAFSFKDSDQGRVYRLVWGSWNIPVTIGDMDPSPAVIDDSPRPAFDISFSWWQTNDELPWDD